MEEKVAIELNLLLVFFLRKERIRRMIQVRRILICGCYMMKQFGKDFAMVGDLNNAREEEQDN